MPLQQDSEKKGSNREWQGACDLNSPPSLPQAPFPLWLPIAEWWISEGCGGDILWDGAPPPDARCRLKAISTSLSHSLSPPYSTHPLHKANHYFNIFHLLLFLNLYLPLSLSPPWCIQLKTRRPKHKIIQKCKIQSPSPLQNLP